MEPSSALPEKPHDEGHERRESEAKAQRWLERIAAAEKEMVPFRADVKRVVRAFGLDRKDTERAKRRFEIAWANREILQSAVYDRPPVCVVKSRYTQGDQLARAVSECMERAVNTSFDLHDAHETLKGVRDQLVDFARGTAWVRYEPTIEQQPVDVMTAAAMGFEGGEGEAPTYPVKVDEKVAHEFVSWNDFVHGKAKTWPLVPWVARRVHLTKDEYEKRFPGKPYATTWAADDGKDRDIPVWEIWCKESDRVYWASPACPELLDEEEPLLSLNGFYPCPAPAFGTLRKTSDGCETLVPIPDVVYYESQIQEINQLTARINALQGALRVKGFYPAGASNTGGASAIEAAIKSNDDNAVLVPVTNFAAFGEKSQAIMWLPVDVVSKVITDCIAVRRQLIDDVYQITGISDIIRGDSEASETLGAQQLKAQWGSIRMRRKQNEMARFARDLCRLTAEIIAEHFDRETLARLTQMEVTDEMVTLMRDDRMRGYVIEIEADSTVASDESQDRRDRMEFGTAMTQGLTAGVQLIGQAGPMAPELAKMVGETLKFVVRGFPAARSLEQTFEDGINAIVEKLNQPQPPPPDPNQAKMAEIETDAKLRREQMMVDAELKREGMMLDANIKREAGAMEAAMQPAPMTPVS